VSFDIAPFEGPALRADASTDEQTVTTRFRGTADVECKPGLDVFVKLLHEGAKANATKRVIVDFRELEFMNSSAFKVFVTWIALVKELPPEQQYRLHFVANPNLYWQRRSLAALACFAVDLVTIET
jgi:hypothetical protein